MAIEQVQFTQETDAGYEWLQDSYFENIEALIDALEHQPYSEYRVEGDSVWASIQAYNAAVDWYLPDDAPDREDEFLSG